MNKKKHKILVLVVEDERALLEAVKIKLEKSGFEVLGARSVDEAVGFCDEHKDIDMVWLDHYLFGQKTGLDFLSTLRQMPHYKKTPIFVVSNTGSPDKRQTYMRLGATKYFVKSDNRLDAIVGEMHDYLDNPEE